MQVITRLRTGRLDVMLALPAARKDDWLLQVRRCSITSLLPTYTAVDLHGSNAVVGPLVACKLLGTRTCVCCMLLCSNVSVKCHCRQCKEGTTLPSRAARLLP
jgi:hypothetical protein